MIPRESKKCVVRIRAIEGRNGREPNHYCLHATKAFFPECCPGLICGCAFGAEKEQRNTESGAACSCWGWTMSKIDLRKVSLPQRSEPVFISMRLDKRVAERFGLSRRGADRAVRRGQVDVAGQTCFDPAREVDAESELTYKPGRPRPETTARRIKIMYEDRDVLIVDKPAGLLTQPTPDRERDTLLERAGRYLSQTRGAASPFVGIVHRIDKQTSGVILLVCSPKALRPFQTLFRSHTNRAIVCRCGRGDRQARPRND